MECVRRFLTFVLFSLLETNWAPDKLANFDFGFDCAEIFELLKSSTVHILPQSQTPRCASSHRVKLHRLHHTAESDSVVCITPQSHKNKVYKKLHGVHPTADSDSAMCIPLWSLRCASHRWVSNLPVSVFIQNFMIVISLWWLTLLRWKVHY